MHRRYNYIYIIFLWNIYNIWTQCRCRTFFNIVIIGDNFKNIRFKAKALKKIINFYKLNKKI